MNSTVDIIAIAIVTSCSFLFLFSHLTGSCRNPGQPFDGTSNSAGSFYNHGYWLSFECNTGFRLVGSIAIECNNGNWSDNSPTCKGKITRHCFV
jgi:hypothetical protein